jgi:hypothetical protein
MGGGMGGMGGMGGGFPGGDFGGATAGGGGGVRFEEVDADSDDEGPPPLVDQFGKPAATTSVDDVD